MKLNERPIIIQAERQHVDVCKGMQKVWDRQAETKELGIESEYDGLPVVYLDFTRCDSLDDRIRVFMECLECGASGFIDILWDDEFGVKPPIQEKEPDDRGNRMGGYDVSAKYIRE